MSIPLLTMNLAPWFAEILEALVKKFLSGGGRPADKAWLEDDRPPEKPKLSAATKETIKVWAVFLLCLMFSLLGVWLSFRVFGEKISAVGHWEAALAIAIVMLGLTYGAKFANADARKNITPVDLIQYVSQGFLWPSTWPALAERLNVITVPGPKGATTQLVELGIHLSRFFYS